MSDENITDAQEQYETGMRYLKGDGVEKYVKKAFYWLDKAATQGHEGAAEQIYGHEALDYFLYGYKDRNSEDTFFFAYSKIFLKAGRMSILAGRSGLLALEDLIDKDKIREVLAARPPITMDSPQLVIKDVYEAGLQLIVDVTDREVIEKQLTAVIDREKDEKEKLLKTIEKNVVLELQNGTDQEELQLKMHSWAEKKIDELSDKDIPDAEKQTEIGKYYYDLGEIAPEDTKARYYEKAAYWFKKAAMQGDLGAQNNLGVCYEYGDGVQKDLQQAVDWYEKAAQKGYPAAQYNLGGSYASGSGLDKDLKKAAEWYTKAAEQDHVVSQRCLARCYENGEGVEKDMKKAVEWYLKAAENGDAVSQFNIGAFYETGEHVEKDDEKAMYWFRQSAINGSPHGQFLLAVRIKEMDDNMDHGDINNYEEALEWAEEALKQKEAFSPESIKDLEELIEALKQELTDHYTNWKEESD
jgi:TPR repeat protein